MTNPLSGLWPPTTVHSTRNEGIRLGIIVGTITWLWVAVIDVMTGRPWHTFSMLGGILAFTMAHYLLNVTYGMVLVSVVHGAERAPSLVFAIIFGVVMFEGAFAMFTNVVAESSVGSVAWVGVVGGSLIGTAVAITLVSRTHPLAQYLRRAEDEK